MTNRGPVGSNAAVDQQRTNLGEIVVNASSAHETSHSKVECGLDQNGAEDNGRNA